jgi:hypothetical protein
MDFYAVIVKGTKDRNGIIKRLEGKVGAISLSLFISESASYCFKEKKQGDYTKN